MAYQHAPGGIVTPEAVRLDLETAGLGSRTAAALIDLTIQFSALYALGLAGALIAASVGPGLPGWLGVTLVLLLVFALLFGYPLALETLWRGRTIGKAALGLRVVTVEGAPVRFRHAFARAALGLVDFYATFGAAAVLSVLLSRRNQRLGDLVAGTVVLRERSAQRAPTSVRFAVPPGAESYAATVDPAGLTVDDYRTVREFLLRAPGLRPEVRADLAARIARPLAARVRHRPPAGVGPELFLACLAARYQRRGRAATAGVAHQPDDAPPAPTPIPEAGGAGGFTPPA
ncbi:MAG TPA: RDD family protein [Egibacteraceae bacterium]|nr:RDD family protein [Egibacteraceae bacterium]